MFANSSMEGMDMASPDVCLTPAAPSPVPIPYPNMAMSEEAVPNQSVVFIEAMPAHNLSSEIPTTEGDEAGVNGGVASGTFMGPSKHQTGCNSVLFEGMPATRLTSTTMQNSTNASGARTVPSQTTVLLLAS
jgi:hypothetical protein